MPNPRGCISLDTLKLVTARSSELVDPVVPSQTLVRLLQPSGLRACFCHGSAALRDRLLLALCSDWSRDHRINAAARDRLLLALSSDWSRDRHVDAALMDRLLLALSSDWSRDCHVNAALRDRFLLALGSGSSRDWDTNVIHD